MKIIGLESPSTGGSYCIKKGVIFLNQAVAIDMTTKPTEESFWLIDELFENFKSNMKEARGKKQ